MCLRYSSPWPLFWCQLCVVPEAKLITRYMTQATYPPLLQLVTTHVKLTVLTATLSGTVDRVQERATLYIPLYTIQSWRPAGRPVGLERQ